MVHGLVWFVAHEVRLLFSGHALLPRIRREVPINQAVIAMIWNGGEYEKGSIDSVIKYADIWSFCTGVTGINIGADSYEAGLLCSSSSNVLAEAS